MYPTTLVSSYQAGLKYDVATTRKSPSFLLSTFCIFAKFVSSSSSSLKKGERESVSSATSANDGSTPRAHSVAPAGFYEREEPPFEWDDLRAVASLGDEVPKGHRLRSVFPAHRLSDGDVVGQLGLRVHRAGAVWSRDSENRGRFGSRRHRRPSENWDDAFAQSFNARRGGVLHVHDVRCWISKLVSGISRAGTGNVESDHGRYEAYG